MRLLYTKPKNRARAVPSTLLGTSLRKVTENKEGRIQTNPPLFRSNGALEQTRWTRRVELSLHLNPLRERNLLGRLQNGRNALDDRVT